MKDVNQPVQRHTFRHPWLMRTLAIAISIVPFVLLEMVLRWTTPATTVALDMDPVVDLQQLRPLFELNRTTDRWEIPSSRYNFFRPDSFLANKPAGSRRIFVLGGSTVQGRPYSIETSFATWLRLRLEAANPETIFEVVNCGGVSYASYRVAKILDEVLQYQPDAIVIYTGHNEFLEDREYAEVRNMGAAQSWIARAATKMRTVTWLQSKLGHTESPRQRMSGEVDARLDHEGGLDGYKRDPIWRRGVESHFAETLRRMVTATKRAGVPLVLCVPAGDLVNTPPFKVEPPAALTAQQAIELRDAWSIARDGDASVDERLAASVRCLAIDPQHAGGNYIAGRFHFEQGKAALALEELTAARDFDVCPLRATTSIIEAVLEIANRDDIAIVRTQQLLDQRDHQGKRIPDDIVDPEFFVDHVHPTIAGHQQIGAEIALQLKGLGWTAESSDVEARYATLVEAHLARLGEEYYAHGQQRLEGLRRWASGRAGKLVPATQ